MELRRHSINVNSVSILEKGEVHICSGDGAPKANFVVIFS